MGSFICGSMLLVLILLLAGSNAPAWGLDAVPACSAAQKLVCGTDGITYLNQCLADVQGVAVASQGECGADTVNQASLAAVARTANAAVMARTAATVAAQELRSSAAASSPSAPGAVIPAAAINRYQGDGFMMVGLAKEEAFTPAYVTSEAPQFGNSSDLASNGTTTTSGGGGGNGGGPSETAKRSASDPEDAARAEAEASTPASPFATPVGAMAVRKTIDGYVYQMSARAASKKLRAALVAAAGTIAGDDATVVAAVAAAGGVSSPGYVPDGVPRAGGDGGGDGGDTKDGGGGGGALAAALMNQMGAGGAGRSLRRLLHIIGTDDRKERSDYPGWPYTAVGHFLFSKGSCSGVMIGPKSVLTAGHCVYSRKRQAWQDKMTFTPYRHRVAGSDTWPVGRIPYVHATTYKGFMEATDYNNALNYDLAVVQLAEEVGYKTGWLGMSWNPRGYKGMVYTAGYPGDKVFGSLWSTSCRVSDAKGTDTRFVTLCDVFPGQSGSPIWVREPNSTVELRAVMTYESCRCCSDDCSCCNGRFNGANAINAMHYASVQAWK